jgi:UDP-N-acetylmuramate dehydrogenase
MRSQPGPHLTLGGGSNVLVRDEGFPGIVLITTKLNRLEPLGEDRYEAEAGVLLSRLVFDVMVDNNYKGTGALTGIPGTIGGAICMNSGTANGTTCQFVESVHLAAKDELRVQELDASMYGYRTNTFCGPNDLIVQAVFSFERAEEDQRAIYNHYIERRKEKQPEGFCCGSVFRNPQTDSAARLIEACGLKGVRKGGAVISPMHANFIMNEGTASSADILWLIDLCRRRVQEEFGIELNTEVRIVP